MTTLSPSSVSPAARQLTRFAAPAGRIFLAGLFLFSGIGKLAAYEASQGYMEAMGVPGALLPAVIASEIIAPLALIAGFKARVAAFLLAGFSIVTALLFHSNFADQIQQVMFLKNLSIAGGLLMIVANGAGAFSFDDRR
ncbi:MAG: DoxX family protein [Pseudomonadota bacterium]